MPSPGRLSSTSRRTRIDTRAIRAELLDAARLAVAYGVNVVPFVRPQDEGVKGTAISRTKK